MKAILLWSFRIALILFLTSRVWGSSIDAGAMIATPPDAKIAAATVLARSNLVRQKAPPHRSDKLISVTDRQAAASNPLVAPTPRMTLTPVLLLVCVALVLGIARASQGRGDVFDYYAGQ